MPRDSNGNYTLPAGNPVVGGSASSATVQNNTNNDIKTELTDSLSRSGKGGLLAPLKFSDGSVTLPAITFTSEPSSGIYRAGAGDVRLSVLGTLRAKLTASGWFADMVQAVTAASLSLKGAVADGAAAVGVIIDNTISLTTAGAKCLSIRHGGVEKAYFDKDGNLYIGAATVTPWQRVVASADTTNSDSAVASDVAGLSFSVNSGKKYLIRARLFVLSAATTTGLGVSVKSTDAPTTSTALFWIEHWGSAGTLTRAAANVADTPTVSFADTHETTAGAVQEDRFGGYMVTTGTGTFRLRIITEVNGSAVTVKAGSYLEYAEFA